MSLAKLQEIEARAEKASPGPWLDRSPGLHQDGPVKGWARGALIAAVAPGPQHRIYTEASGGTYPASDQTFIAHAREDVPALCRALRVALAALHTGCILPTDHDCPNAVAYQAALAELGA